MLCDPAATLLAAINLKKGPGKAARGVFVVDKTGKVLAAQLGSPDGTVAVVKKIVDSMGASVEEVPVESEEPAKRSEEKEDKKEEVKESEAVDEKVAEEEEANGEKVDEEKKSAEGEVAEKDVEMAEAPNGEAKEGEEKVDEEKKDE